jgi:hypothetical protein
VLAAAWVALLSASPGTQAEPGVAITPAKIDVDDELQPGRRYELPRVSVINNGTTAQEYEVLISYENVAGLEKPPAQWVKLQPHRFMLAPGQAQLVEVEVAVPVQARQGEYYAFIEASTVVSGAGQSISAGVATTLRFTVADASGLQGWRNRIDQFLDDGEPWTYLVPAGALLALLLFWSRRYLRYRLPFEIR